MSSLLERLFPRPRRPFQWSQVVPLAVFAAVYALIVLGLELTDRMLFVWPEAFLLMLLTPWVWWLHASGGSGLGRARGLLALWTRLALIGLFVMLLAEPRAVRTSDVISVMYTVDISDSVGKDTDENNAQDQALGFVANTMSQKPEGDQAGLVVFGRNSAVELPPAETTPLEEGILLNSLIDRDATNLEQSLSLAAAMLPAENRGRIVLISDGTETAGDLRSILDELKSRDIAVDVMPIQYSYDKEVWVEQLELPRNIKLGETYEADVVLSSLVGGQGKLVLKENGKAIAEREVTFPAGKSRFTFPIHLRSAGYYEYAATIVVDQGNDNWNENNTVLNYLFVEGEGKVLLVTDPRGNPADHESLAQAIRESDRAVEIRNAYEFPRDALSLMSYDVVAFVNVGVESFDVVQMNAVKDAVENLGIGFLMVGGPNSFGPGGYRKTVIEEVLPVEMDITKKKVLPKGALAIILHTCEFPEGNTWGKRITKQAIKVLHPQDEVGVLVYGGTGEQWLFKPTPASEYATLAKKINGAVIGDMPSFARTMEMALEGLKESDASAKHMIIISDGDPQPPSPKLLADFKSNKITVSTISIFPHGGREVQIMQLIAASTGGRYYFPDDPSLLPSIFIKESNTLKRTMIQNETVQPEVGFPSSILKGITTLPTLHGYVLATAKPRAETILQTPPKVDELGEGEIDPLLVIFKKGLGTSAAFTSDLSTNWGRDWVSWEKYQAFVQQLITRISRVHRKGHLRLWSYSEGSRGTVVVEDFHPDATPLNLVAVVAGPHDRTEALTLKQVGPTRYQAHFPLWGKGRYQIRANAEGDGRKESTHGGLIVSYSPEYLKFHSDPQVLRDIVDTTGGQMLDPGTKPDKIYNRRKPKASSRQVFDWFLVGLACLVPLDVAIRRVQFDPRVILGWFRPAQATSTETMGALLQRKEAVGSRLDAQRAETTQSVTTTRPIDAAPASHLTPQSPGSSPRSTAASSQRKSQVPPAASPDTTSEDAMSTTERLLALKRRRSDEQHDTDS